MYHRSMQRERVTQKKKRREGVKLKLPPVVVFLELGANESDRRVLDQLLVNS